jgi:hypothetical protein
MRSVNTSRLLFAAILLLSVSCNSGEEKKDSTTPADSSAPAMAPTTMTDEIMTIKHKVANFAAWKPLYESHDSARVANGLHNYVIARGVDDSNMVLVAVRMDDVAKAKTFSMDPSLKAAMKKGGVSGAPEIDYLHSIVNDTTAVQQTIRLMIKQKVKDWDSWKKVFDEHKQDRINAGLTDRVLGHTVGDNHQVTLVFAVSDLEKAKAFLNSKDLAERRKVSGVEGTPSFFFYRVVQKY